jgi:hypothetical protein
MIKIDSPCPAKWENMIPVPGGNYCGECCKVVVDFSEQSNEEIANYFTVNAGQRVCGRFLKEQVHTPQPRFKLARFLAAVVLVFGGLLFNSCQNKNDSRRLIGDTIHISQQEMQVQMQTQWKADSMHTADSILQRNLKCEEGEK